MTQRPIVLLLWYTEPFKSKIDAPQFPSLTDWKIVLALVVDGDQSPLEGGHLLQGPALDGARAGASLALRTLAQLRQHACKVTVVAKPTWMTVLPMFQFTPRAPVTNVRSPLPVTQNDPNVTYQSSRDPA